MGVSTDAILFYGYCWDDECDIFDPDGEREEDGDDVEWDARVAAKRGVVNPWDTFTGSTARDYKERKRQDDEWCDANRGQLAAWYAAKKSIVEEFGVTLDDHGSESWRVPYVAIAESVLTANRGSPALPTSLDIKPDWNAKLNRWCEELGVKPPEGQKPQWWLVSWWG